jgi:hypothetical protein
MAVGSFRLGASASGGAVALTSSPPDFLGELSALFLAGLVDDAAGFIMGAPPVLGDGLDVLG